MKSFLHVQVRFWVFLLSFACRCVVADTNTEYVRIAHPDTNTMELQVALRKFEPASGNGPAIWLIAASHIGETNYYTVLQKYLDARTLVLFEGVNAGHETNQAEATSITNKVESDSTTETNSLKATHLSNLQTTFAKSLGLAFQLDAIDYTRPNLRNSDLSVQEIRSLFEGNMDETKEAKQGEGAQEFNQLVEAMSGDSFLGNLMDWAFKFISGNPRLQAMTKLMLIDALGELKGDFSNLQGAPPELQRLFAILIKERNKKVFSDLQQAVKTMKRNDSVGVFFGAGHMVGLENQITHDLHYRAADEVWLKVFSVNAKQFGISPQEVNAIQSLVQSQMRVLTSQPAQTNRIQKAE